MFEDLLKEKYQIISSYIDLEFNHLPQKDQNNLLDILATDKRKNVQNLRNKIINKRIKVAEEIKRVELLWQYENHFYNKGYKLIAGTDEVGRGPIAGPVVAASVILPPNEIIFDIDDSKKLSEKKREILEKQIKEVALAYQIIEIDAAYIDKINILNASKLAMAKAVANSSLKPDMILIDGNQNIPIEIDQKLIIGGDSKSISIAAASILAKVYRDKLMCQLDTVYPAYDFKSNKGYGTKAHYEAIKKLGLTPLHRRSFSLEQYEEHK